MLARLPLNVGNLREPSAGWADLDKNGNRIAYNAATSSVNTVVAWMAINPIARYIQAAVGALAKYRLQYGVRTSHSPRRLTTCSNIPSSFPDPSTTSGPSAHPAAPPRHCRQRQLQ
jgi:hypothetical protein